MAARITSVISSSLLTNAGVIIRGGCPNIYQGLLSDEHLHQTPELCTGVVRIGICQHIRESVPLRCLTRKILTSVLHPQNAYKKQEGVCILFLILVG